MWGFMSPFGLATVVLDLTHELSLLGASLFGLVTLSGGLIVFTAIRHHQRQKARPATKTTPAPRTYQKAA